jgi:hypothetical protein
VKAIAATFAEWGYDYLKYDWLCQYGWHDVWKWGALKFDTAWRRRGFRSPLDAVEFERERWMQWVL